MGEILLGVALMVGGLIVLFTLMALGPVTLCVGMLGFFGGAAYMAGYGLSHHGHPPDASWPLIAMAGGFALCILGGVDDDA